MTTIDGNSILTPALVLVLLSLVVWATMIVTRPRAMIKAGVPWQAARHTADLTQLPGRSRDISDNYNHLMEQPTIFYALVFYTYLAGNQDEVSIALAWAYVALRVVHSLIQTTHNVVKYRFWPFFFSTLLLIGLALRNATALL